jgi:hypothetical protein
MAGLIKNWWWRKVPFAPFNYETFTTRPAKGVYWPDQDELAAWKYELVRRSRRDLDLPEYIDLPGWKRAGLWTQLVLPDPSLKGSCAMTLIGDFKPLEGWTKAEPIAWNLKESDEALSQTFLASIRRERAKQKIALKKNANNRHRSVSWRWPEVLDLSHLGVPLDANDRSKKSQAIKQAKCFENVVLDAALLPETDWIARLTPVAHNLVGRFCRKMRQTFREQYLA